MVSSLIKKNYGKILLENFDQNRKENNVIIIKLEKVQVAQKETYENIITKKPNRQEATEGSLFHMERKLLNNILFEKHILPKEMR